MRILQNREEYELWFVRPGIQMQRLASLMLDVESDSLTIEFFQPSDSLSAADLGDLSTIAHRVVSVANHSYGGTAGLHELKRGLPSCCVISREQEHVTSGSLKEVSSGRDLPVLHPVSIEALAAQCRPAQVPVAMALSAAGAISIS